MTATEVLALLKQRHSRDIFIPEPGTGSSWSQSYGRVDAWACRRSYSRPMSFGYEIKVARHDFLRDNKWVKYLPICSQFYFVAPHGIIARDEIPEAAGFLEVSKNGTKLFTRKKAPPRPFEIPTMFTLSLLNNRLSLTLPDRLNDGTRADRMRAVEEKLQADRNGQRLGEIVSAKTRMALYEAGQRAAAAERKANDLQAVSDFLAELGIPPSGAGWRSAVNILQGQLRELSTGDAGQLHPGEMKRMAKQLDALAEKIQTLLGGI